MSRRFCDVSCSMQVALPRAPLGAGPTKHTQIREAGSKVEYSASPDNVRQPILLWYPLLGVYAGTEEQRQHVKSRGTTQRNRRSSNCTFGPRSCRCVYSSCPGIAVVDHNSW